ncbi:MAG: TetR family transcriptional regulator [Verrucomicrobiaceae bacterium]|nr:TetR family transcriptional regulator [Verrucomicrobiaceae bacterium]
MAKRKDISLTDLLDSAQELIRHRGPGGFSFRDLAAEVGISSASLHHHFPTKDDLLSAVVLRHRDAWNRRFAALAAETEDWPRRWRLLSTKFASPSLDGYLLGMLAANFGSLPPASQNETQLLHSNLTGWLARFVTEAKKRDELPQETDVEAMAHALLSMLQGGLLLGRIGAPGVMDGALRQTDEWLEHPRS